MDYANKAFTEEMGCWSSKLRKLYKEEFCRQECEKAEKE